MGRGRYVTRPWPALLVCALLHLELAHGCGPKTYQAMVESWGSGLYALGQREPSDRVGDEALQILDVVREGQAAHHP